MIILDAMQTMTEGNPGFSVDVTLCVSGSVVTGHLVSLAGYLEAVSKQIVVALGADITGSDTDEFRLLEAQRAAHATAEEQEYTMVYLRDATIFSGGQTIQVPYVAVARAAIGAFVLGGAQFPQKVPHI